jgi:hypothetical protein
MIGASDITNGRILLSESKLRGNESPCLEDGVRPNRVSSAGGCVSEMVTLCDRSRFGGYSAASVGAVDIKTERETPIHRTVYGSGSGAARIVAGATDFGFGTCWSKANLLAERVA